MNKLNITINAVALAAGLMFGAGAMAQTMSKSDYKIGQDKISANYKAAKTACASSAGNAKDICMNRPGF
ncbi:MAG: hypothetical protein P4L92_11570 [Rudaea sp.]|nr:hypothetical protein [Rudaea sp.]